MSMEYRKFVLMVSPDAMEQDVEQISTQVGNMLRARICMSPRGLESLLHDIDLGIRDNLYLSTRLEKSDMEWLLQENLGSLAKYIHLEWLNS
ncbi:hypothetical protein Pla110_03960 [Polystyrenella longa]|uniref:Uncharacterized protein n=1 Tax=Polystyrenella longa TaxID=2528007 RepID=A0A518CHI9_9PLAN|nr:hypothetical protein [Polystyrenella longa]QDU78692.1 hypothetical protein Pla110_03960 [Polystyrenella longa]